MPVITRFCLSFFLALLGLTAQTSKDSVGAQLMGTEGTDTSVRRALLIGINKYKVLPRLRGSINDIETMRQILITRWGFSEQRISMVTDEAATRVGILAALDKLVKETGPQDIVYVHYSGHGSQVQDLNGDEEDDGLDETILAQDGRTNDILDITDDELDEIFARLRARSVLIVLDSCHSGTATRSLDIRTRSVPQDTRIELYRERMVSKRAVVPMLSSRYVLMTGAASYQEALDGPVDGRYHGFFTYALSRSLSSARPDVSPREMFHGVEREFKRIQAQIGRSSMPEPQLEAPHDLLDRPLLAPPLESNLAASPRHLPRLSWAEVRVTESDRVILMNGLLLNGGLGSTWAIYPPGETAFIPGRALAVATVTELQGKDALARINPSVTKIPSGARAVVLLPPPAPDRVSIRIQDVPRGARKLIEETVRKSVKAVDIVDRNQQTRFLLDVQGSSLRVFSAEGLQPMGSFSMDNDAWGAGLTSFVSRSANVSELLAMDNPSSQLQTEVRVVMAKPPITERGVAVVADTQPARYRIRRSGESRTPDNSLQLEVRVSTDAYLTVVDVDSQGGVNLLFPNTHQRPEFHPEGRIRAVEAVLLPDSIQRENQAGFHWDYSPPQGTDTIRVFASTDLETAEMVRTRVQALQASAAKTHGGVMTRSAVAASMGSLRQDLAKVATRGVVKGYDPRPAVPTTPVPDSGQLEKTPPPIPAAPPAQSGSVPAMSSGGQTSAASLSVTPAEPPMVNQVAHDWTATSLTIVVEK
jgi:hypothetical protein